MSWASLSESERAAAAELGYSSDSWDGAIAPAACLKPWVELSYSECDAAVRLGYDRSEWDNELAAAMPAAAVPAAALRPPPSSSRGFGGFMAAATQLLTPGRRAPQSRSQTPDALRSSAPSAPPAPSTLRKRIFKTPTPRRSPLSSTATSPSSQREQQQHDQTPARATPSRGSSATTTSPDQAALLKRSIYDGPDPGARACSQGSGLLNLLAAKPLTAKRSLVVLPSGSPLPAPSPSQTPRASPSQTPRALTFTDPLVHHFYNQHGQKGVELYLLMEELYQRRRQGALGQGALGATSSVPITTASACMGGAAAAAAAAGAAGAAADAAADAVATPMAPTPIGAMTPVREGTAAATAVAAAAAAKHSASKAAVAPMLWQRTPLSRREKEDSLRHAAPMSPLELQTAEPVGELERALLGAWPVDVEASRLGPMAEELGVCCELYLARGGICSLIAVCWDGERGHGRLQCTGGWALAEEEEEEEGSEQRQPTLPSLLLSWLGGGTRGARGRRTRHSVHVQMTTGEEDGGSCDRLPIRWHCMPSELIGALSIAYDERHDDEEHEEGAMEASAATDATPPPRGILTFDGMMGRDACVFSRPVVRRVVDLVF